MVKCFWLTEDMVQLLSAPMVLRTGNKPLRKEPNPVVLHFTVKKTWSINYFFKNFKHPIKVIICSKAYNECANTLKINFFECFLVF